VNIDLNKYNTIPKLFWRQVRKFPDKTTIWKKQDGLWKALTWQQYGKYSQDIGNGLLASGVKKGDKIIGETVRVIKQEKDFARPDKGERIKIRLSLEVEKISLDSVLDRMRVGGIIKESNNESVPHGSHHSFIIKIDQPFNLLKKKWTSVEKKLVTSSDHNLTFILIAIDTSD